MSSIVIKVFEQFADSSSMRCRTCSMFGSSAIHEVVRALAETLDFTIIFHDVSDQIAYFGLVC